MVTSLAASYKIEDVAKAVDEGLLWLQLYVLRDTNHTKLLLRKAEESGYKAVVLTVDSQVMGKRLNDVRNQAEFLPHYKFVNIESHQEKTEHTSIHAKVKSLTKTDIEWDTVEWLKGVTKLPIIIKGILTAEDARLAVRHGVAGIVVSNHGGRQLDTVPATVSIKVVLYWSICSANLQHRFAMHVFDMNLQTCYTCCKFLNRFQNLATHCCTANIAKKLPAMGCYTRTNFCTTLYHCKLALQIDQWKHHQ